SWKVQQLGSRSLHEMSDLFTVLGEVLLEHRDPLRKACRFGADGCRPQSFFATTPARDRRVLRSGQRSSCIDAEVMGPYEGGEHVDAPQSVGVLLVAGTGEDLQRRLQLTGTTIPQRRQRHDETRPSGEQRVEGVGLASGS